MNQLRRRVAVTLAASLIAIAGIVPVTSAGTYVPPTIVVDDDGSATSRGCSYSGQAYTSVQEGIDNAEDGATIIVCPGDYTEAVSIVGRSSLTIKASKSFTASIIDPGTSTNGCVAGIFSGCGDEAIVLIADSYAITMSGFRVVHDTDEAGCGPREIGVWIVASRGISFRGNKVLATGNETLGPCAMLTGIVAGLPGIVEGGTLPIWAPEAARKRPSGASEDWATVVYLYANTVVDYALAGIVATSTVLEGKGGSILGRTDARIEKNSIQYRHDLATVCWTDFALGSTKRTLRSNGFVVNRIARSLQPAGTDPTAGLCPAVGIYAGAGYPDSPISGAQAYIKSNQVYSELGELPTGPAGGGTGPAPAVPFPAVGILVVDPLHSPGGATVYGNYVRGHYVGILGVDARGMLIRSNQARYGVLGIGMVDTDTASILSNKAQENLIGIGLANGSEIGPIASFVPMGVQPAGPGPSPSPSITPDPYVTKNITVKSNYATLNVAASCIDTTSGSKTLGTANIWSGNKAESASSFPYGICGGATPAPSQTPWPYPFAP